MKLSRVLAVSTSVVAIAAATPAAVGQPAPSPMPGMNHGGMHMAPMPAIYGGQADREGAPVFTGLGDHRHPITTSNPQAQRYFDQGINLLFGFNHAEAIRSFREAARLDPHCAMCWWGIAFALGPNINLPMQPDAVLPAWQALQRAREMAAHASPEERAWIDALAARYAENPPADRRPLDLAFAESMRRLAEAYPNSIDAQVFWVEAMMDTQPWDYWEADGSTPKGFAAQIVSTLERVIERSPNHPGALHLYIHAVEASTTPERAEAAADRLLTLMPGAGHIVHMPSHIYYRVGRYRDAANANEQAALVDEQYIASCRAQGFYPAGYYGHNIHFLWTSAEMGGRYQVSLDAARRLVRAVDAVNLSAGLPLVELFVFTPVVTMVRFGRWDEILAEPAPPEALTLDTAVWLYAQAFAQANRGNITAARAARTRLAVLARADLSRYAAFNVPAPQMINLALELVDGEIARKSGDLAGAIRHFETANRMERALPYTEPPYWHQPVSHLLGAALLDARRPAEAERVYRESLSFYRLDGWAQFGLAQALEAQGKTAEAAQARRDFQTAWQLADVTLTSSRF